MNVDFTKYINLSQLSKEQQALFIGAMTDLVMARLADMIGEHLAESELLELEQLSTLNDGQGVMAWLNLHIPNFADGVDEILAEESAELARKVSALTALTTQGV